MREIKYLSNSALSIWEKDREEFYLRYLCPTRVERMPQVNYMAIGSAFDAYAKCGLHAAVYGPGSDPKYEFDSLFGDQVEPQNRDWAREHGKYVFDCYRGSGAYEDLLEMFEGAIEPPTFEFSVEKDFGTVVLLGKPDLRFVHRDGAHVILDWKVRGYCSKYAQSPSKDYVLCRDAYQSTKQSRSHGQSHKMFMAMDHKGLTIHAGFMEYSNRGYADQLAIYSWLLDEKVGDEEVVVGIDELVCKPQAVTNPLLRVAQHRSRVSRAYQQKLFRRAETAWAAIQSGHIFDDLPREESFEKCRMLNAAAQGLKSDGSTLENFFAEVVR